MSRADIEAANPATGEVLERLDQQPPEKLAEAYDEIVVRQAEYKRWGDAIGNELRRRLKLRQTRLAVFGEWEVQVEGGRESSWDADELSGVIDGLLAEGTVELADVTGDNAVIHQPPREVRRENAKRLARRLDGDARAAIEACCTWKDKRGKLTVARSVNLLDAAPGAAEETPPLSDHADRDGGAADADPAAAGSSEPPEAATRRAPPTPSPEPAAPAKPSILDPEELFA